MPLVTTAEVVADALAHGRGVAAFNVITLEHAEAVAAAAAEVGRAVIVQISQNAVRFHGGDPYPLAAAVASLACRSSAEVALHLDHVEDLALAKRAPTAGFSSVMYDTSRHPFAENVALTREFVQWAHHAGLWVEAELGEVGGKDGAHAPGVRTDPEDARRFVEQTRVDALAVAVGSSHAMTAQTARLDHELIAALRKRVGVPLVLHGSSGVPDEELSRAVGSGILKVNIGTRLNVALTSAVRAKLADDATIVDPRRYLDSGRAAMALAAVELTRAISSTAVPGAASPPTG